MNGPRGIMLSEISHPEGKYCLDLHFSVESKKKPTEVGGAGVGSSGLDERRWKRKCNEKQKRKM